MSVCVRPPPFCLVVKLMLAIRRLLNSCVLGNLEQTEIGDGNKENAVRVVDVRRRPDRSAPWLRFRSGSHLDRQNLSWAWM